MDSGSYSMFAIMLGTNACWRLRPCRAMSRVAGRGNPSVWRLRGQES